MDCDEVQLDKLKRSRRRFLNHKFKMNDRLKSKGYTVWRYNKYPRHRDATYYFNRRSTASETGFGVAYEFIPETSQKNRR